MRILIALLLLSTPCIAADYRFDILLAIAKQKAKADAGDLSKAADAYLESAKRFKKSVSELKKDLAKAKQVVYNWRVVRIPRPAGYRDYDVEGNSNPSHGFAYSHLLSTHGQHLKELTSVMSLQGMSTRDIMALHSIVHCVESGTMPNGYSFGEWQSVCPLDGSACVHTFVFKLP